MTLATLLVWILTCAIWSTVWLFIKLGVRDVPPSAFAVFRMSIAFVVLAAVTAGRRVPMPRRRQDWVLIAWTGVILLGCNYALLNWGIQFISSGLTAVLQAMTPVFGFVFAHLLLRDEKMTVWNGTALALGITGVAVIFWDQLQIGGVRAIQGSLAVVAGAVCVAIAYVAMKRRSSALNPTVITAGQLLSALIPLSMYSALVEGSPFAIHWTRTAIVSGVYLALLGSVAGAWLNYWLLQRIGATRLLSMALIEPLVAVLLGAAFLGEAMSPTTIAGGVLILAGVGIVLDIFPARSKVAEVPG